MKAADHVWQRVHHGACRATGAASSSHSWPPGALVAGVLNYSGIETAETRGFPLFQQKLCGMPHRGRGCRFGLLEGFAAEIRDANTRYETQEGQVIQHEITSWQHWSPPVN